MILIIPFGVTSGYVSVALEFQFKAAGVPVGKLASLVALTVLPHTWKFFWAPVVDATLNQKTWYLIAGTLSAIGIGALGFFPPTNAGLAILSVVIFSTSLATTVLGMAVESLMAHGTAEGAKGRAGGWFNAGNLGGSGIGGGVGLILAQSLPSPWMASVVIGMLCLLCSLALTGVPPLPRPAVRPKILPSILAALGELWHVVRQRTGLLALILCFLPIGAGAASGLWSALAAEWRATSETVALVTGVLGGVVSAAGCIAAGFICDRFNRRSAYVWFGILQAGVAVGMALMPRTPEMFVVWTLLYAFITGLTYAGFTAFVLEAIGKGAAATKYSAFASLSNMPIYYMTILDGRAHDKWGSSGILYMEAVIGVVGGAIFLFLAQKLMPRSRPAVTAVPVQA